MRKFILALVFCVLAACQRPQSAYFGLDVFEDITRRDTPNNDLEKAQVDIVDKMKQDYHIDADIYWVTCGDVNAFYLPETKSIKMCEEIETLGQGSVMAAAHEAAHAVTHQKLSETSEIEADELGALEMIRYHHLDGIVEQVKWFESMIPGYDHHAEGDPHPTPAFRAWELACLELGSQGEVPYCKVFYQTKKAEWFMRLEILN